MTLLACWRVRLLGLALLLTVSAALADDEPATLARRLQEQQGEFAAELDRNAFGQPLYLRSDEKEGNIGGDVYARLAQPFGRLHEALTTREQWCEVMILHLNVKRCVAVADGVEMNLGRKFDEPIEQTYPLRLNYKVVADSTDYLRVQMSAKDGPMSTRNYLIVFEAVPIDQGNVFVHFRYAYGYGTMGRLAMQTYLATLGRSKVGFSMVPADDGGKPVRVQGTRGAIERNAMRYYLAIVTYLDSLAQPPEARVERRLAAWYAATERYPAQLHELERDEYLSMKRNEIARKN